MNWPAADALPYIGLVQQLYPFGDPVDVTTEVELCPLVSLGPRFDDLVFTIRNHDGANSLTAYADRSESGVVKNLVRETLVIPPGTEGQFVFHDVLSNFWSISAASESGGNPAIGTSWMIHGRRRAL